MPDEGATPPVTTADPGSDVPYSLDDVFQNIGENAEGDQSNQVQPGDKQPEDLPTPSEDSNADAKPTEQPKVEPPAEPEPTTAPVTVQYKGKQVTAQELETIALNADKALTASTTRNSEAAEARRALAADLAQLEQFRAAEMGAEIGKIEIPKQPVPPEKPDPADFIDDEEGFRTAVEAHATAREKYVEEAATWPERFHTATEARRRKQAEFEDRKVRVEKDAAERPTREQADVQAWAVEEQQRRGLTQEEVNVVFEKAHELDQQHQALGYTPFRVLMKACAQDVYDNRRAVSDEQAALAVAQANDAQSAAAQNASAGKPVGATAHEPGTRPHLGDPSLTEDEANREMDSKLEAAIFAGGDTRGVLNEILSPPS